MKTFSVTLLCLLMAYGCAHGPKITVYSSAPILGQFTGANHSGVVPSVPYAQTLTWFIYPPQGEQAMLDYCANRNTDGTEPPQFSQCKTALPQGGFNCVIEACEVNGFNNGLACKPDGVTFVPFSASTNYLGFTPSDNQTLLDYCNISIQN